MGSSAPPRRSYVPTATDTNYHNVVDGTCAFSGENAGTGWADRLIGWSADRIAPLSYLLSTRRPSFMVDTTTQSGGGIGEAE